MLYFFEEILIWKPTKNKLFLKKSYFFNYKILIFLKILRKYMNFYFLKNFKLNFKVILNLGSF